MQRVIKAAIAALWFMLLTLPVLGIKLNVIESTVTWRLDRIVLLGAGPSSPGPDPARGAGGSRVARGAV